MEVGVDGVSELLFDPPCWLRLWIRALGGPFRDAIEGVLEEGKEESEACLFKLPPA